MNQAVTVMVPGLLRASRIVTIPTDYPTLQDAFQSESSYHPVQGVRITVNIESGHALTAGLVLDGGDYSGFTITSDDSEVPLADTWAAGAPVASGVNCRMPNWNVLVDCRGLDCGGLSVTDNASLLIGDGKGIRNVGVSGSDRGTGLFVARNSHATGTRVVLSGCAGAAAWITHASTGYLERADFTHSGSTNAAVFVSRASTLYAAGSDFSHSAATGLLVRRSVVVIIPWGNNTDTRFTNCGMYGIAAHNGSTVIAHSRYGRAAVLSRCPVHGVSSSGGSHVDVTGAVFTGVAFDGIRVEGGATVIADGAVLSGVGRDAIVVRGGGNVQAEGLSATGAGRRGMECNASRANVSKADLSGAGMNGIIAVGGSDVAASGANVRMGATDGANDVVVSQGSTVRFAGGVGGTNVATNGLSAAGIIFR